MPTLTISSGVSWVPYMRSERLVIAVCSSMDVFSIAATSLRCA